MGAKFLPLEISGKPLSQCPRRSVLLEFCKQTKQPISNYDHNSGRKLLFRKLHRNLVHGRAWRLFHIF